MSEDLKKYLYRQLSSISGLCAIVVSDRDGVPVLKVNNEKAPEFALRSGYLSTFPLTSDLSGKLGFGKNNYFICSYSNYTVVHFNRQPLTLSFIASSSANTGLILNLGEELKLSLDGLKQIVKD
uniref:ragulator complex protein LAMTOR3-like n=1 Tax=Ciona intestinalis TaxID=7719 RepID=UPI0005212921|nr:ragulator complex protein LAMTOR3-like [Ciona intestinalis]|eukprot:XP_026696692.1 ragulator complex protein LAMTOR3-like [Ciona intestinalis]